MAVARQAAPDRPPEDLLKRLHRLVGNGRFWVWFWLAWIVIWLANLPFALTVWQHSLKYLIFISVMALVLASCAALQASLTMRKADPDDPL